MKKFIIFLLVLLLVFSVFLPSAYSGLEEEQQKLQQYKKELEEIKRDLNNLTATSQQVLSLLDRISSEENNVSQNIDVIQNKITALQNEISETENLIQLNKSLIEKNKNAIATSLALSYKLSYVSPISVFFSGKSASASVDKITYISYVISSNKTLLDDLTKKVNLLNEQKSKLQKDNEYLTAFLKDKESEEAVLKQEIAMKNELLSSLKERKLADLTKKTLLEEEIKKEQEKIKELIKEAQRKGIILKGGFIWPVRGPITSPFGWRINPIWHSKEFHPGIDIAVATGTPVKAAADGIVSYAGWMNGYGNVVIIYHGSDISTLYAHLKRYIVRKGERVKQGQIIAYSDNTGWSTGPHLHFGVYLGDKPVNPLKYLP